MPIIETKIDKSSESFLANYNYNKSLLDQLNKDLEKIKEMGPPEQVKKHKNRNKLTARERINLLKDENCTFLEFSEFAAKDVYDDYVPAAAIITGLIDRKSVV